MILANEQVAQLLERKRVPAIYRVHAQPDPPRIERLIAQLHALEIPTPPLRGTLAPREAAELAAEASRLVAREAARRGHGREAYTSLVLRSLKQAPTASATAATPASAAPPTATSPRRSAAIRTSSSTAPCWRRWGRASRRRAPPRRARWPSTAASASASRCGSSADADDVCAAYLLERELRERGAETAFEGEVSGVIRAGAFVAFGGELGDVYEGFLPARRLGGAERFELNETETALVGRESERKLRLGDPVSVQVSGVEAARGRVDLEPVED